MLGTGWNWLPNPQVHPQYQCSADVCTLMSATVSFTMLTVLKCPTFPLNKADEVSIQKEYYYSIGGNSVI